jgi:uncharacterized membrane protein
MPDPPASAPSHLARERDDLLLLAAAAVLVPLVWRLLLGWNAGVSVSGFDAMATIIPVVAELVAAGGDWSALAYRADLLGGMKVRDAIGPFPPFAWLASMGLGTTAVYNASAFLVQALLGALGARAATDLARAWGAPLGWGLRLAGILLVAFVPPLGWRMGYGHLTLVVGLLPFMAGLALVTAAASRTVTVTLALASLLSLHIGILFTGHQLVFYGAVFGAPILLGAWWALGRRPRALALPALVGAAALALAVPAFRPVLAHARSSDSPRALGGMQITYSYLTQRPVDWLASLPWTRKAIPGGQPELHHHETNVPLGPLLALLALVPWRRTRALGWGALASALLALLFAMNARPLSTALLALVPPLNSFRVPTRAILPFALTLPVLVTAALGQRRDAFPTRSAAIGVAAVVLVWLPAWTRELVGWGLALALVATRGGAPLVPRLPAVAVAGAMAFGGIGAFRERLLPFPAADALLASAQAMGRQLEAARPELTSALSRVSLGFESPELGPNTAFASGLSALEGYYFPSRRYIELFCALHGYPYQPNALLLRYPASEGWTRPAFALYNVTWFLQRNGDQLSGRRLGPTNGPAWFGQGFEPVSDFAALGRALLDADTNVAERVRQRLFLVASDPALPATLPREVAPACAGARVLRVDETPRRTGVRVTLETPADCPLAVAMNFVETLRAEASGADGAPRPALVFPACGSLAGVWVPAGTRDVLLEAP